MKKREALFAIVMISVAAYGSDLQAQTGGCAQALIQDVGSLDLRETGSLARAELFRRERGQDINWAAGLTIPIKGVPVSGSAESAEATREHFFQSSELSWNTERLASVSTQTLSRNAVEAYRACIDGQHKSGPRILVHNATREQATVSISWQSPTGGRGTTDRVSIDISGGTFRGSFPNSWIDNESNSVIVDREAGQDMRVVANIGAETDNVFVSRVPPPPPPPSPPALSETSLAVTRSDIFNSNQLNDVRLTCSQNSVLSSIRIDETASGGVRTPTGYRATCIGPVSGTGQKIVSVEKDQIFNPSPENDISLDCPSGSLMTALSVELIAIDNRRSAQRFAASCSPANNLGATTVVRVEKPDFWNPTPTNTVKLDCSDGSAISAFKAILLAAQNLRTAIYYDVTCTEY